MYFMLWRMLVNSLLKYELQLHWFSIYLMQGTYTDHVWHILFYYSFFIAFLPVLIATNC